MPSWDPSLYLKFGEERTQACRDLVARITLDSPRRIVDLGCGPGNSAEVLLKRWPDAIVTGVDSSEAMLAARERLPNVRWQKTDITSWVADEPVELVFSNAALHWPSDHEHLIPRLFDQVAPGGALAWQVPSNFDAPAHVCMRDLAASPGWRSYFTEPVREWNFHPLPFYYDLLAPSAIRIDLWTTEYLHVMDGPSGIIEWYKGTGLRPFLDRLESPADQERFLDELLIEIERLYLRQPDGRVLCPFSRQFAIAYRK